MKPNQPVIMVGVVTKTYPERYKVDVQECNTDKFYKGVPIATIMGSDDDHGFVAMPEEHDLVLIALINNSNYDPVVIGRLYSEVAGLPSTEVGAHVYKHHSGTTIKIANDGTVTINSKNVILAGDSTVGHTHGPGSFLADGKPVTGTSDSNTDTIQGAGQ